MVKRRINITVLNLKKVPYQLRASGFLPIVPCILGVIGVMAALRTRRTRHALLYLLILAATSLAPVLSHVEARFKLITYDVDP